MKFTAIYKAKYPKAGGNSYKTQIEAPNSETAWTIASTKKQRIGYRVITIETTPIKGRKAL
jgi:hypothetical protein